MECLQFRGNFGIQRDLYTIYTCDILQCFCSYMKEQLANRTRDIGPVMLIDIQGDILSVIGYEQE